MTILNGGGAQVDVKVKVKVKRLHPDAVIPQYATAGAAGFDLVAVEDVVIAPGETKKVTLGLAFEIPEGYVMYVCMRSGIALKTKLRQSNGIGVIDSDYRGEVAMVFDNTHRSDYAVVGDSRGWMHVSEQNGVTYGIDGKDVEVTGNLHGTYIIRKGDRVCQGIIAKVPRAAFVEVAELGETERGAGGFGSSGIRAEVSE
ncbi:dUTP diphosphatase [Brevibacillus borstelensis]|uniref:dUTP diphosphatase n=1 Tax=Brevibacillus borstelensis TaxID=45462 RepID=UPI00287F8236|nr:dUTP diphosphatase [Brevibacillus borstelensis]WNF08389.1 dUTP diphosphatase [Brevibacillus borstelensis]